MSDEKTERKCITLPREMWQRLEVQKKEVGIPISTQIRKAVEAMQHG